MALIEANAVAYYDNLSAAKMDEEADWGRIGAASLELRLCCPAPQTLGCFANGKFVTGCSELRRRKRS